MFVIAIILAIIVLFFFYNYELIENFNNNTSTNNKVPANNLNETGKNIIQQSANPQSILNLRQFSYKLFPNKSSQQFYEDHYTYPVLP